MTNTYFIYVGGKYINIDNIRTITSKDGSPSTGSDIVLDTGVTVSCIESVEVESRTAGRYHRKIIASDIMKRIAQITGQEFIPAEFPKIIKY